MKKRFVAVLLAGVMGAAMLTACGSSSSSSSSEAEVSTSEAQTAETDAAEEDTEAADESATEASSEETTADASSSDITYVDGYYAADGNGSDFIIAFFEGAAGDVAYVNDGTNEALAEYTVENAQTDDGTDYLLVTVGNTQIGYYTDGDSYYIIDSDGNVYQAAQLSEEEADALYSALQEADNGDASNEESSASNVQYVDGYYANNGNGSDFIIAFFTTDAGDVAYVNDGTNEVLAEYSTEDATTDSGTDYTLITIGNTQIGYYTDGSSYYIIDSDGDVYEAAQLSEEEADALYNAVQEAN